MPFCPNCRYEYKPEVWECPDCGARLVATLPPEGFADDTEEESAQNKNLVPLRDLPSGVHAQMLQEALENEGIHSIVKQNPQDIALGFAGVFQGLAGGGVTVWVSETDLQRASEIADQMMDRI
jgi:hypothetical protein